MQLTRFHVSDLASVLFALYESSKAERSTVLIVNVYEKLCLLLKHLSSLRMKNPEHLNNRMIDESVISYT